MCNKCSKTEERKMTHISSNSTQDPASKIQLPLSQYSNGFTAPNRCQWHPSQTHKNSILEPGQNLIRAGFVEIEGAREKQIGFFFLLFSLALCREAGSTVWCQRQGRGRQVRLSHCWGIGTRQERGDGRFDVEIYGRHKWEKVFMSS